MLGHNLKSWAVGRPSRHWKWVEFHMMSGNLSKQTRQWSRTRWMWRCGTRCWWVRFLVHEWWSVQEWLNHGTQGYRVFCVAWRWLWERIYELGCEDVCVESWNQVWMFVSSMRAILLIFKWWPIEKYKTQPGVMHHGSKCLIFFEGTNLYFFDIWVLSGTVNNPKIFIYLFFLRFFQGFCTYVKFWQLFQ